MAEVDGVGAKPATPPPPPPLQPTPPPPPPPPPGAGERDGSGAAERRPAQPPAAKDGTSPPSRGAAALASKRKKPASVRQTPEEKKRRTDRKQLPRTPSEASQQTGDEARRKRPKTPPDAPGSELDGSELDGSELDGSELDGSELDGSELDGSELDGSELDGSELDGSELDGSELDGSELDGSELDGSELDGSELDGSELERGVAADGRRGAGDDCAAAGADRDCRRDAREPAVDVVAPPRTPSVASRQTGDEAPPDGPPTATTARQRALIAAAAATHENRRWTSWRWAVPAPQKAPARRKRPQTPPDRAPALPPAADATDGLRDRRDPKQPPKQRKQRPPRTGSPEAASARVEDGRRAPSRDELFLARQLLPPVLGTQDLEGFAQYLKTCKNVVVCVGAGASVAAGIPDFRTPGKGLYSNERLREYNVPKPEDVFNLRYFRRRPDACYSMLEDMWPGRWPPTRVHYFLKLLELKGCLSRVYTQNIDDLERLAGVPKELLVEAHGTFSYVQCVDCGFSPSVAFMRAALARGDRPLCPECLRKGLATATGIPLGDAHLPPPEAKPGDSPDLKDKGSGNPTDPQTPPAAAAAADACKPGAALKEPGSPPLPASPAAVGEGRSPAASAAAAAAAAGVNPFAPAEAAAKQARRFLFVYGSLRPDDSAGLEPTHPLFKSADFMPSTLKGVRLYHDKRPAIRLPDPGASPNDEVVGYLVR
ncbi:NAD-dependent protein deacetylase hst2-1, partial [Diplonema papillatum]